MPQDAAHVSQPHAAVSSAQHLERHRFDNGSVTEVGATGHDLVVFGQSALPMVLEDIAERQRSIAALETSGRIHRLLAENSTNLISTFDAH